MKRFFENGSSKLLFLTHPIHLEAVAVRLRLVARQRKDEFVVVPIDCVDKCDVTKITGAPFFERISIAVDDELRIFDYVEVISRNRDVKAT